MASFSNFLLNAIGVASELATTEPDIRQVHVAVDALASMGNSATSNTRSSPTEAEGSENPIDDSSPTANATTNEGPMIKKRKLFSYFFLRNKSSSSPAVAIGKTSTSTTTLTTVESSQNRNSNNIDNTDCFFDANEKVDDPIQNPHDILYPTGNKTVTLNKEDQIAWATVQYGQRTLKTDRTKVTYKKCLGVYVCPYYPSKCNFCSRPKVPKGRGLASTPLRGIVTHCIFHQCPLTHISCDATFVIRERLNSECVEIVHRGNHDHPRTHQIHVTKRGKDLIREHLNREPTATPISLKVGTSGRHNVAKDDPSLINIGRLRAHVAKQKKSTHVTADIAAFDKLTQGEFITDSSLSSQDGCIIMQTATMRKILKESEMTSETDTIEGFVYDSILPDANLTVTSSFCTVQDKWVPTQMSLLFGKSTAHYHRYFNALLKKGFEYEDFKQFDDNSMGMVCDFSDAERSGFKQAIETTFNVSDEEYKFEKFYTMCVVHFRRSESRVRRNNGVVSVQRKDDFRQQVKALQDETDTDVFWQRIKKLKSDFPRCQNWINWYINPLRGQCFFPSLKLDAFVGNVNDTNAQESTGRTIQLSFQGDKTAANLAGVFHHLYRFAKMVDMDYASAASGAPIGYSRRKSPPKRPYKNDGRAPDTNETLFPNRKQKTGSTGRKKGQPNKVPLGKTIVPTDIAIPWSFCTETEDSIVHATNTCAMDTVLMGFYLLRQHDHGLQLLIKRRVKVLKVLDSALDMIHEKRFNEARLAWMDHCRSCNNGYFSSGGMTTSTTDGKTVTKYNCQSSISTQIHICCTEELFKHSYFNSYNDCINEHSDSNGNGGEFHCKHFNHYHDPTGHAERSQNTKFIAVPSSSMRTIQTDVLDMLYNTDGAGDEVECGSGTREPRNAEERYPKCNGRRLVQKVIVEGPPILHFERGKMMWERDQLIQRSSRVKCMTDLEHQLVLGNQRYALVYCILSNQAHFQGIAILYGSYLRYDGMGGQQKLKWYNGSDQFDAGYCVESLWYKLDGFMDDPAPAESSTRTVTTLTRSEPTIAELKTAKHTTPTPTNTKHAPSWSSQLDPTPLSQTLDVLFPSPTTKEPTTIAATTKKQKRYPTGISVHCVSSKGRLPQCKYCQEPISRGEWHSVNNTKSGEEEKWRCIDHYHFQCYDFLSKTERQQLVTLIAQAQGSYMDAGELEELEVNMGFLNNNHN